MTRVITITSDNYLQHTLLLLESLRNWHPQIDVDVYALTQGWSAEHEKALAPLRVNVHHLQEQNAGNRKYTQGAGLQTIFKLEVYRQQQRPFLYIDSDCLILRPLDRAFEIIQRIGWLARHDGYNLGDYYEGDITRQVALKPEDKTLPSLSAGIIGCDPIKFPVWHQVIERSNDWASKVSHILHGDQGLISLAFYDLCGGVPADSHREFNHWIGRDGRTDLDGTILHVLGWKHTALGSSMLEVHRKLYEAWPKDANIIDLRTTEFWQQSLPHPWPYLNQCDQPAYRNKVRQMREQSMALLNVPWLLWRDPNESYLLNPRVVRYADQFWRDNAHRLAGFPHRPTYHLGGNGKFVAHPWQSARRWYRDTLASLRWWKRSHAAK